MRCEPKLPRGACKYALHGRAGHISLLCDFQVG